MKLLLPSHGRKYSIKMLAKIVYAAHNSFYPRYKFGLSCNYFFPLQRNYWWFDHNANLRRGSKASWSNVGNRQNQVSLKHEKAARIITNHEKIKPLLCNIYYLIYLRIIFRGTMEERVRELFKDGLKCNEEVEQIKNIYKYVF